MCLNINGIKNIIMTEKIDFEREYFLHQTTQTRLNELFDLEFIASEFQLHDKRLDNLAFDCKNNSFVIIEYKNDNDPNVINQVESYYDLLKNNKKEFINLLDSKENVDFEKTKVMIISTETISEEVKDYIEIWKVDLNENLEVTYRNMKTGKILKSKIRKEELEHSEDDLLNNKSSEIQDLYHKLKDVLLSDFDDVTLKIFVDMVSFRANNKLICLVNLKNSISIHYFAENLNDEDCKIRNISDITTGDLQTMNLS